MLGLSPTQLWIALAILAGIVILIISIAMIFGRPSASFEGGRLSIPRSVKNDDDSQRIEILIPAGYSSDQLAKLAKALENRLDRDQYDPLFLASYWAIVIALFDHQFETNVEIHIDGDFSDEMDRFAAENPSKSGSFELAHALTDHMMKGDLQVFRVPSANEIEEILSELSDEKATYQSCGEGCCKADYRSIDDALENKLLPIHRNRYKMSDSIPMVPDQHLRIGKNISTFAHYPDVQPLTVYRSLIDDRKKRYIRPYPFEPRGHHIGPHEINEHHQRPSQDAEVVLETI